MEEEEEEAQSTTATHLHAQWSSAPPRPGRLCWKQRHASVGEWLGGMSCERFGGLLGVSMIRGGMCPLTVVRTSSTDVVRSVLYEQIYSVLLDLSAMRTTWDRGRTHRYEDECFGLSAQVHGTAVFAPREWPGVV